MAQRRPQPEGGKSLGKCMLRGNRQAGKRYLRAKTVRSVCGTLPLEFITMQEKDVQLSIGSLNPGNHNADHTSHPLCCGSERVLSLGEELLFQRSGAAPRVQMTPSERS